VPGTPVGHSLCLIYLNKTLENFHDKLDPLGSLVGLASVMADSADEMAVKSRLKPVGGGTPAWWGKRSGPLLSE
jgi:hypothetical protein